MIANHPPIQTSTVTIDITNDVDPDVSIDLSLYTSDTEGDSITYNNLKLLINGVI